MSISVLDQNYWRQHPVEFLKTFLKIDVAPHQKKILNALIKYNKVSVVSSNGIGKSFLLAGIIIWFFYTHLSNNRQEKTIVVFTAPTFAQVKDNLYYNIKSFISEADDTIKEDLKHIISESLGVKEEDLKNLSFLGEVSQNQNLAEIRFNDVNYIMGVSSSGENKVVGKHGKNVLVVFDEAQGIEEKIYSDFNGILMSGKVRKEVMIGNSTIPAGQSSKFYNSFKDNSGYHNIKISAFDTPNFINPNIRLDDYLLPENDENYWRNKLDRYTSKILNEKVSYYTYKKFDDLATWEDKTLTALGKWGEHLINPLAVQNILIECGNDINSYEFLTRVRAEFPTTQSGSLIPKDYIVQSTERYKDSIYHSGTEINMGVDVGAGKDTSDPSAIAITCGNRLIYLEEYNLEILDMRDKILELYKEYNVESIRIETDGVGQPLYDVCKPYGLPLIGIQTGSGAGEDLTELSPYTFIDEEKKRKIQDLKRKFNCKRDELWWNFREMMNPYRFEATGKSQILLPDIESLRNELSAFTYTNDKKIIICPKKDLRKKLKKSPNSADAVMFAFAEIEQDFSLDCGFKAISLTSNINRNIY